MFDDLPENLTDGEKARIQNIDYIVGSIGLLGSIVGIVYAKRTGGKFWRYVGYWILGGIVFGVVARIIASPARSKILSEADQRNISRIQQ